ncbi:MAG: hypothetical protein M3256_12325, partial [Actinomycetota bacterium]|nr:hypothetical protein [Actinomycetota bacterium]
MSGSDFGDDLIIRGRFIDDMSAPAAKARAAVDAATASMSKAGKAGAGEGTAGIRSMSKANDELAAMAGRADSKLSSMSDTISSKLVGGLKAAALGYGALAVAVTGFGLKTAAGFEQNRVAYGALLGDVQKGNDLFAQLQKFNFKTPFQLKDLTATTQQLLAMGFAGTEVMPILKSLSDVAAASQDPGQSLQRIGLQLG